MPRATRRRRILWWSVAAVVVVAAVVIAVPVIRYTSKMSRRLECGRHLRDLGDAMTSYCAECESTEFMSPQEVLQALVAQEKLTPEDLVCPAGGAPYVWVPLPPGAVAMTVSDSRIIVAYEPVSNHEGEGANVLFLDGHIDFERAHGLEKLLAESERLVKAKSQPPQ